MLLPFGERRRRKEKAALLSPWRYVRRVTALEEAVWSCLSPRSRCRQAPAWHIVLSVQALSASIPYCRRNAEGCRNAGLFVSLWFQCAECMLDFCVHPLVADLLWSHSGFPLEAMDTLSSILENPLQKQFWGVSAFPYYIFLIYFYVRSSIFVM